jgi:Uncharacterised nucleotidyltransferase
MDARHLAKALADPSYVLGLNDDQWTALLCMAHAERLTASLAWRLDGLATPQTAAAILDEARSSAEVQRVQALWEAEMARRALAPLGIPVVLLKGTAYVAAGVDAGRGRLIGDLDILVPRDQLDAAEAALLSSGWEWVNPDPYDDAYYRTHMHELPPLIHAERDRMIDVHHTILPLTARVRPDAAALLERAVVLTPPSRLREGSGEGVSASAELVETGPPPAPPASGRGEGEQPPPAVGGGALSTLAPEDMLLHAVAHLFADGDLAGGLRNLWDIDRLVREFADAPDWWQRVHRASAQHSLTPYLSRALRLAHHLFDTPVDPWLAWKARPGDVWYLSRILARDRWGRETRTLLRLAFYIRSHWIRMPPLMLARHLFVKWRKGRAGS